MLFFASGEIPIIFRLIVKVRRMLDQNNIYFDFKYVIDARRFALMADFLTRKALLDKKYVLSCNYPTYFVTNIYAQKPFLKIIFTFCFVISSSAPCF